MVSILTVWIFVALRYMDILSHDRVINRQTVGIFEETSSLFAWKYHQGKVIVKRT